MPSNTLQNYEQLSYGSPGLSMHRAKAFQVVGDAVATRALTAKESGGVFQFDVASGVVYTLPTPVAGMTFDFVTSVTITSGSAKILTGLSSEFLLGALWLGNSGATTGQAFAANGTTIRSVNGNGTTTGGTIGDIYRIVAMSSTVWYISGMLVQTGVAATRSEEHTSELQSL